MEKRKREIISEIIGADTAFIDNQLWRYISRPSYDPRVTDYEFWDKFRRGTQPGYEFGCLFANPIAQIVAAYTLGDGVTLALDGDVEGPDDRIEHTNRILGLFSAYLNAQLLPFVEDLYALADNYLVLNPDGSISIPPPNTVEATYDPEDYRKLIQVKITTISRGIVIEDVFTAQERTITRKNTKMKNSGQKSEETISVETFPNLIGRIPIVHFANDRGVNETHGRVLYEALLPLFARYDDVLTKGSDGVEILGNPIPTITGLENASAVQSDNAPIESEEYTDEDGNTETRHTLNVDNRSFMLLGVGTDFKMVSPHVGFTEDVRSILKMFFLLILDHTRIPEAVWGGAIASSRASAETQMPPFHTYINRRRRLLNGIGAIPELGVSARGGLLEAAEIFLLYRALTDRQIMVEPVVAQYDSLGDMDDEIKRKWVEMFAKQGVISGERMLTISGLVDDPAGAIKEVEAENEQSPDNDDFDEVLRQALNGTLVTEPPSNNNGSREPEAV